MIVKNKKIDGIIFRDEKGFHVDVRWGGWGSNGLFQILNKLGLADRARNLNIGERIVFHDQEINNKKEDYNERAD